VTSSLVAVRPHHYGLCHRQPSGVETNFGSPVGPAGQPGLGSIVGCADRSGYPDPWPVVVAEPVVDWAFASGSSPTRRRRMEHNARDWIAWARTRDHDAFWNGTWPTLRETLPESAGRILDLGCGEGRAGRQLLDPGRRVLGIERSATLARAAATGSPRACGRAGRRRPAAGG
jgi:hypothetical protein